MKKGRVLGIILVILLVLALVLGGAWMIIRNDRQNKAVAEAESAQAEAYAQYMEEVTALENTTLTVTENGRQIGVYSLEQLGLWEPALAEVRRCFGDADRMTPEEFAALEAEKKIRWQEQAVRLTPSVVFDGAAMDCGEVMLDLAKEIRVSPKNAYAYFEDGAYAIAPEVPGTQLDNVVLEQVIRQTVDGTVPGELTLEVADYQPYLPAQVTAAEGTFDYAALLQRDSAGVTITVELLEQTRTLEVLQLVTVDADGVVQADREALSRIAAQWAEETRAERTPYILDSFVEGPIALDFLLVDYELDQDGLVAELADLICKLENGTVKAPFFCTRNGEAFAIEGTYVEVDIDNQHMTYYMDGEVLVDTDVVTGYPWGNWTPPGLYAVQNIDVDCWLSGEDYNVFVEYWVGFHGAYGIHDASWRTIFGGKKYLTDGSHGCVNTPTEPMQMIHSNIEVGTPVVVHDEREPDDY